MNPSPGPRSHGWRVPATVAVVERDGRAFLAPLPDGPILVLDAPAAAVWRLAQHVGAAELPAEVAAAFEVAVDVVHDDVLRVVEELTSAGVLERRA